MRDPVHSTLEPLGQEVKKMHLSTLGKLGHKRKKGCLGFDKDGVKGR